MSLINSVSKWFRKEKGQEEHRLNASDYIGKFVKMNSADIGESIAVEKGRIIVKNQQNILSIPHEAVSANAENIIVSDFNMDEAIQQGKEWFDRKDTLKFDEKGMLIK